MNNHAGYGDPSDTYRPADQGTAYPEDAFTRMVTGTETSGIEVPAPHSYAHDGNMETYQIAGEYSASNEEDLDLGRFTGAVGPAGRTTPASHPEPTAP